MYECTQHDLGAGDGLLSCLFGDCPFPMKALRNVMGCTSSEVADVEEQQDCLDCD